MRRPAWPGLGEGYAEHAVRYNPTAHMGRLWLLLLVAVLSWACRSTADGQPADSPAVAGAASPGAARGRVTVYGAASLTDAFQQIGATFEQANPGTKVTFNFGASSALRLQLEQGARADVFASADQKQMDAARRANLIDGLDQPFAKNRLVVIVPSSNPARISSLADLARPGIKLVLTDRNVPIGAYARTALEQLATDPAYGPDFDGRVLRNLRSEEPNVRAVVTRVQLGEADAGIVYASDVTPSVAKAVQTLPIPDAANQIARYPIALVRGDGNRDTAVAFVRFVRTAAGQEILRQWGFLVDSETGTAWVPLPAPLRSAGG